MTGHSTRGDAWYRPWLMTQGVDANTPSFVVPLFNLHTPFLSVSTSNTRSRCKSA